MNAEQRRNALINEYRKVTKREPNVYALAAIDARVAREASAPASKPAVQKQAQKRPSAKKPAPKTWTPTVAMPPSYMDTARPTRDPVTGLPSYLESTKRGAKGKTFDQRGKSTAPVKPRSNWKVFGPGGFPVDVNTGQPLRNALGDNAVNEAKAMAESAYRGERYISSQQARSGYVMGGPGGMPVPTNLTPEQKVKLDTLLSDPEEVANLQAHAANKGMLMLAPLAAAASPTLTGLGFGAMGVKGLYESSRAGTLLENPISTGMSGLMALGIIPAVGNVAGRIRGTADKLTSLLPQPEPAITPEPLAGKPYVAYESPTTGAKMHGEVINEVGPMVVVKNASGKVELVAKSRVFDVAEQAAQEAGLLPQPEPTRRIAVEDVTPTRTDMVENPIYDERRWDDNTPHRVGDRVVVSDRGGKTYARWRGQKGTVESIDMHGANANSDSGYNVRLDDGTVITGFEENFQRIPPEPVVPQVSARDAVLGELDDMLAPVVKPTRTPKTAKPVEKPRAPRKPKTVVEESVVEEPVVTPPAPVAPVGEPVVRPVEVDTSAVAPSKVERPAATGKPNAPYSSGVQKILVEIKKGYRIPDGKKATLAKAGIVTPEQIETARKVALEHKDALERGWEYVPPSKPVKVEPPKGYEFGGNDVDGVPWMATQYWAMEGNPPTPARTHPDIKFLLDLLKPTEEIHPVFEHLVTGPLGTDLGTDRVVVMSNGSTVNPKYLEMVMSKHPNARWYDTEDGTAVLAVTDGKVVGVVSKMGADYTRSNNPYIGESIEKVLRSEPPAPAPAEPAPVVKKPRAPRKPKTVVAEEPVAERPAATGEQFQPITPAIAPKFTPYSTSVVRGRQGNAQRVAQMVAEEYVKRNPNITEEELLQLMQREAYAITESVPSEFVERTKGIKYWNPDVARSATIGRFEQAVKWAINSRDIAKDFFESAFATKNSERVFRLLYGTSKGSSGNVINGMRSTFKAEFEARSGITLPRSTKAARVAIEKYFEPTTPTPTVEKPRAPRKPKTAPTTAEPARTGPEPAPVETPAKAKEPWEMTKKEYWESLYQKPDTPHEVSIQLKDGSIVETTYDQALTDGLITKKQYNSGRWWGLTREQHIRMTEPSHSEMLAKALSEGKPVPAEVLADYPDLAAQYAPASAPSATAGKPATAKEPWDEPHRTPAVAQPRIEPETTPLAMDTEPHRTPTTPKTEPAPAPPKPATAKEPWEMTREEYQKQAYDEAAKKYPQYLEKPEMFDRAWHDKLHDDAILEAARQGKVIPEDVLDSTTDAVRREIRIHHEDSLPKDYLYPRELRERSKAAVKRVKEQAVKDKAFKDEVARQRAIDEAADAPRRAEEARIKAEQERQRRVRWWEDQVGYRDGQRREPEEWKARRRRLVERELADKKHRFIPPEVLADYPDLAAQYAPKPTTTPKPAPKPEPAPAPTRATTETGTTGVLKEKRRNTATGKYETIIWDISDISAPYKDGANTSDGMWRVDFTRPAEWGPNPFVISSRRFFSQKAAKAWIDEVTRTTTTPKAGDTAEVAPAVTKGKRAEIRQRRAALVDEIAEDLGGTLNMGADPIVLAKVAPKLARYVATYVEEGILDFKLMAAELRKRYPQLKGLTARELKRSWEQHQEDAVQWARGLREPTPVKGAEASSAPTSKVEPPKAPKAEVKPAEAPKTKTSEPTGGKEAAFVSEDGVRYTGIKKAAVEQVREAWDLDPADTGAMKSNQQSLDRALAEGYHKDAHGVMERAIGMGRALTPEETAGVSLRYAELINENKAAMDDVVRLRETGTPEEVAVAMQRVRAIQSEANELFDMSDALGRVAGQDLQARKIMVRLDDYSLMGLVREAEKAKGSPLTDAERVPYEKLAEDYRSATEELKRLQESDAVKDAKIKELEAERRVSEWEQEASKRAQKEDISRRTAKKLEEPKAKRERLKKELLSMGYRLNDVTGLGLEASYKIGQIARTYIDEGVIRLSDIVQKIQVDFPRLTAAQIHEAIITPDPTRKGRTVSPEAQKWNAVRSEASTRSKTAALEGEIEAGTLKRREPPPKRPYKSPEREAAEIKLRDLRRHAQSLLEDQRKWDASLTSVGRAAALTNNTLRTLRATADISATFRQGLILAARGVSRDPVGFAKIAVSSLKAMINKYTFEQLQNGMVTDPRFYLYRKAKGHFSDLHGGLSGGEELYVANLLERVPYFKEIVAGSERHMTVYLNMLRTDAFYKYLDSHPYATTGELEAVANMINVFSGRGNLGSMTAAAPTLGQIFFAPRFAMSRLQAPFAPLTYLKERGGAMEVTTQSRNPLVRVIKNRPVAAEAAKSLAATAAFGGTVMMMAKLAGASVESDPRSSDWGKIRVGDTRFDVWGGMQQPMRQLMRFLLQGGKAAGVTEGVKGFLPEGEIGRFGKYKFSPLAGYIYIPFNNMKTVMGEDVREWGAGDWATNTLLPIGVNDIVEAYKSGNTVGTIGAVIASPTGISVNTYETNFERMSKAERVKEFPKLNPKDQARFKKEGYDPKTGKKKPKTSGGISR